jgi:hypothetical protein
VKSRLKFNLNFSLDTIKPLSLAGALCILILSVSCSSIRIPTPKKKAASFNSGYQEMTAVDYSDHLASLKKPFLNTPGIKVLKLDPTSAGYLQKLASEIISHNEIFFKDLKSAQITVLENDVPLHFSLPKGEIFLSSGLLAKYIKHESMLVSVFAYELVRSEKLLYPKITIIPTGFLPLERMLLLSRLNLEEKVEVHKWAYHLTVRSGYDGEYYLSWLQTQNRNTADFLMQVGDASFISREESLFKAFLIKHAVDEKIAVKKTSSKSFYNFLNKLRDRTI